MRRYRHLPPAVALALLCAGAAEAAPPAIRTSDGNKVPACVTPARLMHYVRERNPGLESRYDEIARWYRTHGESWKVRWDYAFFQMIVETNALKFRTGSGRAGDVKAKQNNFAGIGTTGGGVPGDGYPDVSTGVLAQIQHLVAYSGERLEKPVAPRTQLTQDDIISKSARLKRAVTFSDLAGRWAVDKRYWRSIEAVAEKFREMHCEGKSPIPDEVVAKAPKLVKPPELVAAKPRLPTQSAAQPKPVLAAAMLPLPAAPKPAPAVAAPPRPCTVQTASYVGKGGAQKTVLVRAETTSEIQFTALQVLDGFQRSMADGFIRARAPGGAVVGEFDSPDAAMGRASELCAKG